jgi:outer membrane protein OmpA-like peptidoglycan-associated protein
MTLFLSKLTQVGSGLTLALALATGCATSQPSKELLDARDAYTKSEQGKARQYNPAALHEAKVALDKAEAAFEEDPESEAARDEAYLALRRAERAEIEASTLAWEQRKQKAQSAANQAQAKGLQKAQSELASTREQLAAEKTAREAAEAKSKETLARLAAANAAAVKEEPRGTVITLAGGVLFASNKSQLLPGATQSLDTIAEALKDQDDKRVLSKATPIRAAPTRRTKPCPRRAPIRSPLT